MTKRDATCEACNATGWVEDENGYFVPCPLCTEWWNLLANDLDTIARLAIENGDET